MLLPSRLIPLWLPALTCLLGADTAKTTEEAELKQFQEAWKVTSADVGGTATYIKQLRMEFFRIEGNKLNFFNGDREIKEAELKLDPTTFPKQMDWLVKDKGQYP